MKNILGYCFVLLLLAFSSKAGNPPKAKWIGNPPSGNRTMYFVIVHTDASSSLDGARTYSLKELASNVERTDKVNVNEVYSDKSQQIYDSQGQVKFTGSDDYFVELRVEGSAAPIHSRRVDEYWRTVSRAGQMSLDYYALYAVERVGAKADFSIVEVSNRYGIQSMWRSFIVPGWGQMYKGSYAKGGIMIGGIMLTVAGTIYSENQRGTYVKFMSQTHDANIIRSYQTKVNQFATVRNICIGGIAALYLWNVVDALVSPGASHVKTISERLSISPVAYNNAGIGLSATYSF